MNRNGIEEKRRHATGWIPYSYYACAIPDYFPSVPLHWHNEFELNYILMGEADFLCGEERFTAHSGDIVLTTPGQLHAIHRCGEAVVRYETVVFRAEMLGSEAQDRASTLFLHPLMNRTCSAPHHITADMPAYTELHDCVCTIVECARSERPLDDLLMKSALLRFFFLLWDGAAIAASDSADSSSDALRPALEYISAHLTEPISIDQLAASAHMSRSYFMEQFRKLAGMSAITYVNHLRVRHACELLRTTERSAAQIAFDSGFRNLSNFNRHFRKVIGCTPVEYRKLRADGHTSLHHQTDSRAARNSLGVMA